MEMKFRAHDTFFIRKGWISKGMRYVAKTNGDVFISKNENPMDVLGIFKISSEFSKASQGINGSSG